MAVQSRADNYTQSGVQQQIYSDFLADLNPHPQTGDIVRYVNENAVKRSIRNIILTNPGERLFNPKFGGGINTFLFDPIDSITATSIQQHITQSITNYEPRCKLIGVTVIPDHTIDAYIVTVQFMIINNAAVQQATLTLYRVR